MKTIGFIFFMICSTSLVAQNDLIDSLWKVQKLVLPNMGSSLCTEEFWNLEHGGGPSTFRQIALMPLEYSFRLSDTLSDTRIEETRGILSLDFYKGERPIDRVYLYIVKEGETWKIDGMNEVRIMMKFFMEGKCSGHFTPLELPEDHGLAQIGTRALRFADNDDQLATYFQSFTVSAWDCSRVVSQLTTDDASALKFSGCGYSEEYDLGYLYFEKFEDDSDYSSTAVLYVHRQDDGKYAVIDYDFGMPSADSFLYAFKRL